MLISVAQIQYPQIANEGDSSMTVDKDIQLR